LDNGGVVQHLITVTTCRTGRGFKWDQNLNIARIRYQISIDMVVGKVED